MMGGDAPRPVRTLAEAERVHILKVLQQSGGVVGGRNGAAARLGMARTTLIFRMRKLGIAPEKAAAGQPDRSGPIPAVQPACWTRQLEAPSNQLG